MASIASVEEIRLHFPALKRTHNGYPVAYFDGPGGTQVPSQVGNAITGYLYHHNANTHWAYPSSAETDVMMEEARKAYADFLNAKPEEIAFGANMTTLTMHLGRALGMEMQEDDELIVTELDHHANVDTWKRMARERGMVIRTVKMNAESGQIDWDHFASLVSDKTRLIAVGAASNALGTINDVKKAVALARKVGAYIFVDAVHYASHHLADVKDLGCDFLACSVYKFYGPHVGVLYARHDLVEKLDVARLVPAPNHNAERLETGTLNHEGIAGATAAVNFLADLHSDKNLPRRRRLEEVFHVLDQRGHEQVTRLWNGLKALPHVHLFNPAPDAARTSTLSFVVDGLESEEVTRRLAEKGVFTTHGDFYATTVAERLGRPVEGMVRAGCACYTTNEEIDRLIAGLSDLG